MKPIDHNLALVEAMLAELQDYLRSPEVFWPLSQRPPANMPAFPRLTLGGLILSLDELEALESEMDSTQSRRYETARRTFDAILLKQPVAIENKAAQEARIRLDLWRAYLTDVSEGQEADEDYVLEVRQRVILARLIALVGSHSDTVSLETSLAQADAGLRTKLRPEPFVWDSRLEPIYPREHYWFLYGRP